MLLSLSLSLIFLYYINDIKEEQNPDRYYYSET